MKKIKSIPSLISLPFIYIIKKVIRFYKLAISPYTVRACRYTPSCSEYALEALDKHGLVKGLYLATKRYLSCNPWGGLGYDPVPEKKDKNKQ